jgi:hypothetical protein
MVTTISDTTATSRGLFAATPPMSFATSAVVAASAS